MAFEFKNILSAMGLKASTDTVTEAHLQAADDKIALLTQEKADADTRANAAEAARVAAQTALDTTKGELATANTNLTQAGLDLKTAQDKVATLEEWKKNQAAADGREEDDSNNLDTEDEGPKASWEVAASKAIATAKKRVGEK
ncbi:hypothetical protein MUN81_15415 [Hymenobacter sp. 5317J-9]|uniref:hypothetical protein n=1 Tax=Hymenobacter sp. 5317J-9 TaxID=2932250 RepID=UPI001FD6B15E|nr:hypothetical protein [Hymenobacter sp. 5317J-9]UOQ96624.1 hypothetical protein MUN81_15415 [Hymenobacter sp. 5317J-9]